MVTSKDGPGSLTPLPSPPQHHDTEAREAHIATPSSLSKSRNIPTEDMDSDHMDSDEAMDDLEVETEGIEFEDDKASFANDPPLPKLERTTRSGGAAASGSGDRGRAGPSKATGSRGGRGNGVRGRPAGDKSDTLTPSGDKILDRDYPKLTFDPFYDLLHPPSQPSPVEPTTAAAPAA